MPTLNDKLNELEGNPIPETNDHVEGAPEVTEEKQGFNFDFSILWADSPDIPLEEYKNHPVNFNNSLAMSRILRGLEGFGISMRKALFDIVIGIVELKRVKVGGENE